MVQHHNIKIARNSLIFASISKIIKSWVVFLLQEPPCDGVQRAVKWLAANASLKANHMTSVFGHQSSCMNGGREKHKRNIPFFISSETVCENSLKYHLDNYYSLANKVNGTRSLHSFIPTSSSSIKMRHISSHEYFLTWFLLQLLAIFLNFNQASVACVYDDRWYIGTIVECNNKNNNGKVKFMKRDWLCLSWYNHNNECWFPYQYILINILLN